MHEVSHPSFVPREGVHVENTSAVAHGAVRLGLRAPEVVHGQPVAENVVARDKNHRRVLHLPELELSARLGHVGIDEGGVEPRPARARPCLAYLHLDVVLIAPRVDRVDIQLGGSAGRVGQAVDDVELHHGELVVSQNRPEQQLDELGLVLEEDRHVLVVHERQPAKTLLPFSLSVEERA